MDELQILANWTGWPLLVAIMLLGGGFVSWLLNSRIERLKDENARLEKEQLWSGSYSAEKCQIRVVSPSFGDPVPRSFIVNGTFQQIPERAQIWVCTVDGDAADRQYWPQGRPAKIDRLSQTWHARVVWLQGDTNDMREIAVLVVGEDGQALIDYYVKAGEENTKWPSIVHLTRDMKECVAHKVVFSGEETA